MDADVIVIGAGLSGLVVAAQLAHDGRRIVLLDQEPEGSLGGQAFWSLGGLFFVDSPEQRRLRIRDSYDLARADWMGSAAFDRPEDYWPRAWAEAYLAFAAGENRSWLQGMGMRWIPVVQWAERGGYAVGTAGTPGNSVPGVGTAGTHGNSVPRFHLTWGTGPGVVAPFLHQVLAAAERGQIDLRFRHRVTNLAVTGGVITGVDGDMLAPSDLQPGAPSSREITGHFSVRAQAVVVASGGIGANHELIRRNWPRAWGTPPRSMISGVPDFVDGSLIAPAQRAGARVINADRMWHYPEGVVNHSPIWSRHGIRILSGPSPLWFDAHGKRLPAPLFPGFDSLGALRHITSTGYDHSWFVLDEATAAKEFALSGSEQNPDITAKDVCQSLARVSRKPTAPVRAFLDRGVDFLVRDRVDELVRGMNDLVGEQLVDAASLRNLILERDRQVRSGLGKDPQLTAIAAARRYAGDRISRIIKPHAFLDGSSGRLVAVRLHVLTRKTLGGLETDLAGRVLQLDGTPIPGLFAAGEVCGFGGGGMHGYRALEGTFLGGCLFTGRTVARSLTAAL